MKDMKIVVLDGYTLNPGDLTWEGLEALGTLEVHERTEEPLVVQRAQGADLLLTNKTPLSAEVLRQLKGLRYIGVLATGYNVVDVKAARELGIPVSNIPTYGTASVAQFAVDVIKVRHIIVCGHYGCGGVRAALRGDRHGLVDNWLRHVQDVRDKHESVLKSLDNEVERSDRLCELNVIEQVLNVCQTSIVRDAWYRGQELTVHSWIYGLHDGLIRDLGMAVGSSKEVEPAHRKAVASLGKPATKTVAKAKHTLLLPLKTQRKRLN